MLTYSEFAPEWDSTVKIILFMKYQWLFEMNIKFDLGIRIASIS
jgi:hypothetical protein